MPAFDVPGLPERWPHLIAGLGVSLAVALGGEVVLILGYGVPYPVGYYAGVVTSLPFLAGLVFGAYWIDRSGIPTSRYTRIGLWCVAGLVVNTVFILGITLASEQLSFVGIVSTVRWAAAMGAGIGLLIGVFDARSVQRAFEAGQARRREEETRLERDRLEEFASVISHDLRNPLSVAEGNLDLAREERDSEELQAVADAHDHMETLIEDVLALARAGEAIGEKRRVELSELAETCWRNVDTRSASLDIEVDGTIWADETRTQQLLENLFRNAIEHGGTDVTITVSYIPDGFAVEDDGPGIPPDERRHVLDPGYSTADDGTGFGLSIVRDITDAHGWVVEVTEGTDGGARFEFTGVERAR